MKTLGPVTFAPTSGDSTYRLSMHSRPIKITTGLSWVAQLERRDTVSLPDGGTLAGLECRIDVTTGEPFDGKESDQPWDHAHGLMHWVDGSEPVLIRLIVPTEMFASLSELAERGHLPSLRVLFMPGHGLENNGPYGPIIWHTDAEDVVPVQHIEFIYSFSRYACSDPSDTPDIA